MLYVCQGYTPYMVSSWHNEQCNQCDTKNRDISTSAGFTASTLTLQNSIPNCWSALLREIEIYQLLSAAQQLLQGILYSLKLAICY